MSVHKKNYRLIKNTFPNSIYSASLSHRSKIIPARESGTTMVLLNHRLGTVVIPRSSSTLPAILIIITIIINNMSWC